MATKHVTPQVENAVMMTARKMLRKNGKVTHRDLMDEYDWLSYSEVRGIMQRQAGGIQRFNANNARIEQAKKPIIEHIEVSTDVVERTHWFAIGVALVMSMVFALGTYLTLEAQEPKKEAYKPMDEQVIKVLEYRKEKLQDWVDLVEGK
jgi:hypothetical protein